MKKLLSFTLALIIGLSISIPAFASTSEEYPNSDEIYNYLINAGYPTDFIDTLDDTLRLRYYEGGYTFESSDITYGIFTEDYAVQYSLDNNGHVIIDDENLQELESLLSDTELVSKILAENITSNGVVTANTDVLSADDIDYNTIAEDIENGDYSIELLSLSNWSASIVCSHISYNTSTKVAKKILHIHGNGHTLQYGH